jgi:hypothetical protein
LIIHFISLPLKISTQQWPLGQQRQTCMLS